MLNYQLQMQILASLASTYIDEKRIELTSKQFNVDQDEFVLNITYLKREKLIDLSSLSSRAAVIAEDSDKPATKNLTAEAYVLARCIITHCGFKTLCNENKVKYITACTN